MIKELFYKEMAKNVSTLPKFVQHQSIFFKYVFMVLGHKRPYKGLEKVLKNSQCVYNTDKDPC